MSVSFKALVLVAENYEDQVKFYKETLGLNQVGDWGDACKFEFTNGVDLVLFSETHDQASLDRLTSNKHGISHLEFGASGEQLKALEASLDAQQMRHEKETFLDPDGQLFHFA